MKPDHCRLSQCFFCRNTLPEWNELAVQKKTVFETRKGSPLFKEGEAVKGIFFLQHGTMKITKKWVEGKDLIVRFANAGDVLGHRGFGGDMKYPVSAIAMEASEVCFIDNDFLATSLKANPSLTYAMMQIYARDLQHAEKRMSDLVLREVVERIVLALTEIAGKIGLGSDGFIALPVSRQDIASFAGTSYETVFKFFTRLSNDNIITTVGKKVKINDPVALNAFLSGLRQQS